MTDKLYITSGTAVLSDSIDEGGPYTIHGVALGAGDVTTGSSGVKKLWPPEELKKAAETLAGTPLVKNHTNTVEGVIGEVSKAKWKDGVGVLYEAEIDQQYHELAEKIMNGRLEVSVRAFHAPTEELDEDDDTGAKIVESVKFDNLSVVPRGASPSNTAEVGAATEMSATELRDAFEYESEHDVEETGAEPGEDVEDDEATVTDSVGSDEPTEEEAGASDEETSDDVDEELTEMSYHTPTWDGTTRGEWSRPNMEDFPDEYFDEDDNPKLGEFADHFLLSASGFESPDKYTDLAAPVVEPNGELSLGGLRSAIGGHGVQAVDGVSSDMEERAINWILKTAEEEFDETDWDGTSEDSAGPSTDEEVEEAEDESSTDDVGLGKAAIWNDDPSTKEGGIPLNTASSSGGLTELLENFSESTMTDLEDKIAEMNEPVVIEEDDLGELEDKAEKFETVDGRLEELGDTLDELGDAKALIDEAGREQVESLRDSDEPTVVEQSEYDELREAVEDVKTLYAETLAEHYPMDEETLGQKFDVLELRDMLDETEEAELAAHEEDEPEPKGGQATEDELEETNEEVEDEEALESAREQYAAHYEELGWDGVADRVRSGELSLDEMGADL